MLKKWTLFFFFLILCGCRQNSPLIKIGINPWPGYEPLAAAKTLGLYKKHGLNVQIYEYTSLSDVKTAFEQGHIDIICSTIIEMLAAHDKTGKKLYPLIVSDYSNGPDVIIGKNLKNVKELKGKRIGLEIGSLGIFMLGRALQKNNLSLNDVKLIPLDQSQLEKAFKEDTIDAAVSYPPVSIKLVTKNSEIKTVFSSAEIPYEVIDIISVSEQFLKKNPSIKEKILDVWDEVLSMIKNEPNKVIPIMAKREGLSVEEFKEGMEGLVFLNKKNQILMFDKDQKLKKAIESAAKFLSELKIIKKNYKYKEMITDEIK